MSGTRQFYQILCEMRDGRVDMALTEELAQVLAGVQETGKVGELSLKLKITPDGDAISIETHISTKIPKQSLGASIFYEMGGALFRSDPRQGDLDFPENVKRINQQEGEN